MTVPRRSHQVVPLGRAVLGSLCPTAPHRRPQPRHHVGWKQVVVSTMVRRGADGSHRRMCTSTPSSRPEGHPFVGGELSFLPCAAIQPEAVSLTLGSLPPLGTHCSVAPPRFFMPGPREPTDFPSSASPTPSSAWGVESAEEFRGIRGMLRISWGGWGISE